VSIALLWLRVEKSHVTKSLVKTKQTACSSYESFSIFVHDKDHEGLLKSGKKRVVKETKAFLLFSFDLGFLFEMGVVPHQTKSLGHSQAVTTTVK